MATSVKFRQEDFRNAQFEIGVLLDFRCYCDSMKEEGYTLDDIYEEDSENFTMIFKTLNVDEVKSMFFFLEDYFPTVEIKEIA